jgi:hypothetical protein
MFSSWMVSTLEAYGNVRDAMTEAFFLNTYGSPLLQAMMGLDESEPAPGRRIEKELLRETLQSRRQAELEHHFESGTPVDAALRALVYVLRGGDSVDERTFAKLRMLRAAKPADIRLPIHALKQLMTDQSALVRLDEERAVGAIPKLLSPESADRRHAYLDAVHSVLQAHTLSNASRERLQRVDQLFNGGP